MQPNCVRVGRVFLAVVLLIGGALGAGCNGGGKVNGGSGGAKGQGDGSVDSINITTDGGSDKPDMASCVANPGKGSTDLGQACRCHSDCGSNFCVDGVCCNSACTDKCMSCNLPGSEGTCGVVPDGVKPRDESECAASAESSCGLDGTCDGMGACRKHVLGTVCFGGTCDGDGMSGINICDGAGACRPGPAASCFPYTCAADKCLSKCTTDKDCSAGRTCMGNSCGKLPTGRGPCTTDDECTSGHCADGVCCNVGCSGECVSCNQTGFIGQCRPVGVGLPHKMCAVQPRGSCGTTGVCDGFGSCALYPAETTCIPPKCAGNMLNTAGTCDGEGTCRAPGQIDCAPFMCAGESCVKTCTTDAQCVAPNTCVGGSCGKKPMGSPCTGAAQCDSNQCVDGVCCDTPCTGACQSCSLQSSLGQCKNVARGAVDPHAKCKDTGASSCGTDGKCDGAGACRKYAVDTVCGADTCVGGAYTPPATCNASGQCIPPASQTCAPFACNGSRCFEICTSSAQCVPPNTCVNGSCGLKPAGANCSAGTECQRAADGNQYCSQGVCCNGPCTTACQACNLAGSLGTCTAVANNVVDPQKKCATTAAGTCGTNGKCRAGVCDTYHTTDQCKPAACSNATTALAAAFCDGRGGACPAQTAAGCGVYICDAATGACKNSCTTSADCVAPNTCNGGSCGKKSNGAACSGGTQCLSGNCTEGVCCNTACTDATTGTCQSCKVAGKVGTCSPVVLGGADPKGRCLAAAQATCGQNGTCDGAGKCDFWDTGTGCRAQSCTGNLQTNTASCNGNGACPAATTKDCSPYICNTAAATCRTTCTSNADCVAGVACNTQTNKCGDKLPNGRVCAVAGDCTSAQCVKNQAADATGVCCNTACGLGCESCSLVGKVGTCSPIAAGGVPRIATMCPTSTNVCGNTGRCNGTGACQIAPNGTTCNDGNACTVNDACAAGTCGGTAMVCTAADQCHTAGVCNPANGMCSNPAKAATATCSDGNACTDNDVCGTGTCAGVTRTCEAADQCHAAGICNPATGMCSNPAKPPATVCNDGNACTDNDTCATGACRGMPKLCTAPDQCHNPGTCDPTTGECGNAPAKPGGTTCNDGNSCTTKDVCTAGVCAGSALICPAPPNQCLTAGTCNATTGECGAAVPKANGAPCVDTDPCTATASCQGGTCVGGSQITCPQPTSVCQTVGSCVAGVGCPAPVNKPNGTDCGEDNPCLGAQTCQSGGCVKAAPVQCPAPGMCEVIGTCNPDTGRCSAPTPAPDGTPCRGNSGDICCGGVCSNAPTCAPPPPPPPPALSI